MRTPLPLLIASMTLLLPSLGSAADANSPVSVTLPPSGVGDAFIPFGRPVAELEQSYLEADNLDRSCDEFDDGLFNGSCP